MNGTIPHVGRYMSICPFTIGQEQTLIHAHLLMREHDIRHLPVVDAGKLVGVLSERDLHLLEAIRDVDPEKVRVAEAMTRCTYAVPPSAPLEDVVHEMAEHKYGSAIVVDHEEIVGVFTTVDAVRAFSELLCAEQVMFMKGPDRDEARREAPAPSR